MRARLNVVETSITLILNDSEAAQALVQRLPVALSLSDYSEVEKIGMLPERLPTVGAPEGYAAQVGDVAYYAPWGNLAIFRKAIGYTPGLIKLGQLRGAPRTPRTRRRDERRACHRRRQRTANMNWSSRL